MASVLVQFFYHTSFPDWPALDITAELRGNWNKDGRFSEQWSASPMARADGSDGCAVFRGTVQLDSADAGQKFEWGVAFKRGAGETWAIPTEVKETGSRRQTRAFTFLGYPQTEEYYFTHCRRLGANRCSGGRIQFAVWAPNAKSVELVAGTIFEAGNPAVTVPEN